LGNLGPNLTASVFRDMITKRFNEEFTGPRIVFNREVNKSLGYGYITVANVELANKAIAALTGLEVQGNVLKIEVAQERRILRAVYVGNLASDVTEEDLLQLVQTKFGAENILKVRLAKDVDGRVKGFGHIEFNTAAIRDQAINDLNGAELKGRPIKVDKAVLKSKLPVVCINNVSYDVTKQNLEDMFDDLVGKNNYSDVRLHYDRVTGYPRGFAHVTFASKRHAMKALEELKGIEMMGRLLRANLVDKNYVKDDKKVKGKKEVQGKDAPKEAKVEEVKQEVAQVEVKEGK